MKEIAKSQVEEWKDKHGNVFLLEVDDKRCYLRQPTRKELSASMTMSAGDILKGKSFLLNACWLDGDPEIKTDDGYFLGAISQLDEIVNIKAAEVKKL